jgi:undecaprenyl-diphosphatase
VLSLWRADVRQGPRARLAWSIAAGNVPIVALGLGFRHVIETALRSLYLIAAMLALVALALALAEQRRAGEGEMEGLGLRRILLVGLFQALALIPGASRSGTTILGGLLVGLRRAEAARFSFLLGIPAILGAALLELPTVVHGVSQGELTWTALALGLLTAGVAGYLSIAFLLRYLKTRSTLLFVWYRLGLAVLVAALAWQGLIG